MNPTGKLTRARRPARAPEASLQAPISEDPTSVDQATAAVVLDRILRLVETPDARIRILPETLAALRGLDIWVWGDLAQPSLENWRRLDFEPLTGAYAFEDLLVFATLAKDWHAVATCAVAIDALRRYRQEFELAGAGQPPFSLAGLDVRPPAHESRAVRACVAAWNARAARLRGQ